MTDAERISDRAGVGPLVSVVMPTFNSEKTVLRALKSVFAQTYDNIEIIIADDASRDGTRRQVESLADGRLTFLESDAKTNLGPAASRNRALAVAQENMSPFSIRTMNGCRRSWPFRSNSWRRIPIAASS